MSVTTITRNSVHRSYQTGSVGGGSDHLQMIKFWRSCAPVKGVCGGAKIFGSALLRPARSVYVSSSAFSYSSCVARYNRNNSVVKILRCNIGPNAFLRMHYIRYCILFF